MSDFCFLFFCLFVCFAKQIIVGRLSRNIHPSLQYSSRSRIHTSLYDDFFLTCTSCTMPFGYSVHNLLVSELDFGAQIKIMRI